MKRMEWICAAAVWMTALAVLAGCESRNQLPQSDDWLIKKGDAMPAFKLPTVGAKSGGDFSLADYRGTPVVISLFATWCGPCRAELPLLQSKVEEAMNKPGTRGVRVIAISSGEDAETVEEFTKELGLTFPVLVDESRKFYESVAGDGIPRLIVLDAEHRVRELEMGFSEKRFEEMVGKIEEVISEAKGSSGKTEK